MSADRPALPRTRIVRCPTCSGDSVYGPDNPHRPFCSERCRNLDFGAWASEAHRVPAAANAEPDDFGADNLAD